MASARIQRWALTHAAYQYTIKHKPGTSMSNADALSRLPLKSNFTDSQVPLPIITSPIENADYNYLRYCNH